MFAVSEESTLSVWRVLRTYSAMFGPLLFGNKVRLMKSSASEPGLSDRMPKIKLFHVKPKTDVLVLSRYPLSDPLFSL